MRGMLKSALVLGATAGLVLSGLAVADASPNTTQTLICGGGLLRMSRSISGAINCGGRINTVGVCYTVGNTDPGYRDITNQYNDDIILYFTRGCAAPNDSRNALAEPGDRWVAPAGDPSFGWHSFMAID